MKDQFLSIEQMQHLKELGVDTSKASMYWARKSHGRDIMDESKGEWFLSLHNNFIVSGFTSYEVLPTFTLQDILEMMPAELYLEATGNISLYPKDRHVRFHFHIEKSNVDYVSSYKNSTIVYKIGIYKAEKTALESVYHILCWLAENKLLGKEEKK